MNKLISCLALILALCVLSCNTSKKLSTTKDATTARVEMAKELVGMWNVAISGTPVGDLDGQLIIEKVADSYKGYVVVAGQKIELTKTEVADSRLDGTFYSDQYGMEVAFFVEHDEENDTLSGMMMESFAIKGNRKEE